MRRFALTTILTAFVVATIAAAQTSVVPRTLRELVIDARTALAEERYADAVDAFTQLDTRAPGSPQIAYNLGLAHAGAGDWPAAAQRFDDALQRAGDPALRRSAAHNMMSSVASRARELLEGGDGAPVDAERLQALLDEGEPQLDRALEAFRRQVASRPDDTSARQDAEYATGLRRLLEELREQMEEQQQQQQNQEQDPNQDQEQNENQQQQQQQPQGSQDQEREQDDQQQQAQQEREREQDQQQEQEQEQQQEQQERQDQQESEEQRSAEQEQERQAARASEEMTREEAERLLQQVRDKERQRREQLAREQAQDGPPVEKDW